MKNNGKKLAKKSLWKSGSFWVLLIILGVPAFFVLLVLFPAYFGASEGVHRGVVTAVEYNSNVFWPATLVYFKTSIESTQEDRYCANDETVKEQLWEFSRNRKEAVIYYKNAFVMWKSQCNKGESIIYRVEEALP